VVNDRADVTGLLLAWRAGDDQALDRLLPLVHEELRQIARRHMAGERRAHTLQPTALVNEAYVRLLGTRHVHWQNRTHFLAMASRLMRRVLVDLARSKRFQKRGAGAANITFDEQLIGPREAAPDLLALDEALDALSAFDERKARVVEMRFFGGLSVEETASVLDVSSQTVMRDWRLAKAWLLRELRNTADSGGS
jgi:RNA polymerase sigma factor (TIGR02999 family)